MSRCGQLRDTFQAQRLPFSGLRLAYQRPRNCDHLVGFGHFRGSIVKPATPFSLLKVISPSARLLCRDTVSPFNHLASDMLKPALLTLTRAGVIGELVSAMDESGVMRFLPCVLDVADCCPGCDGRVEFCRLQRGLGSSTNINAPLGRLGVSCTTTLIHPQIHRANQAQHCRPILHLL